MIKYAINKETGTVISKVNDHIAIPVLQYDISKNDFLPEYKIEKKNINDLKRQQLEFYNWTDEVPLYIKKIHKKVWDDI